MVGVSGLDALSRGELLALVASQAELIEVQATVIGQLTARVGELNARVVELERRLGRNSGNSSMPPSVDDVPGRTPPPVKPVRGKGAKRKPGKQPGAPGSNLAWRDRPG